MAMSAQLVAAQVGQRRPAPGHLEAGGAEQQRVQAGDGRVAVGAVGAQGAQPLAGVGVEPGRGRGAATTGECTTPACSGLCMAGLCPAGPDPYPSSARRRSSSRRSASSWTSSSARR